MTTAYRVDPRTVAGGAAPLPPSGETIRRFRDTARRYGYWNATPEENARLGLVLPAPR